MSDSDQVAGAPPAVTRADVAALVDRILRIPDSVRKFRRPVGWAWDRLRIRPELVRAMAEHGLPSRTDGDRTLYDTFDLTNAAMYLGCGPVARASRRFWPVALRRAAQYGTIRYELQYETSCPDPGHGDTCHYEFALPGGEVARYTMDSSSPGPRLRTEVTVSADWPELPADVRSVLDEVADVEFVFLPEALRYDVGFVREHKLGDCAGVTRLLFEAARLRGMPVRGSYGLVVAPPFATPHYFAEFPVGDVWVPVDPVLIRTMLKFGVLEPGEWDPYSSLGVILCRLGDHTTSIARHEGVFFDITVPTRLLTTDAPAGVAADAPTVRA